MSNKNPKPSRPKKLSKTQILNKFNSLSCSDSETDSSDQREKRLVKKKPTAAEADKNVPIRLFQPLNGKSLFVYQKNYEKYRFGNRFAK